MSDQPSADEEPKATIADKVITKNQRYFMPDHGFSVSARSASEAASKADKKKKAQHDKVAEEEGDAK